MTREFRDRVEGVLRAGALAAGVAGAGLFVAVALLRVGYPFELEWVEGGILDHVRVAMSGAAIYREPDLEFVAFHYPPLYYYVAALPAALMGPGFLPLRLVSLFSSLACATLIFAWVRRETGVLAPALAAGLLYLATFDRTGGWLDVARIDAFFMATAVAALYAVRFATSRPALLGAGLLLAAACLAKQTALVIALPIALASLVFEARRTAWWAGTALGAWALAVLLLSLTSDGYFLYYSFEIPRNHPVVWAQFGGFWSQDLLPHLAIACALAAFGLVSLQKPTATRLFYASFAAGVVGAAWSIRSLEGAHLNDLIPAYAGISILAGLGLHELLRLGSGDPRGWRTVVPSLAWTLVAAQFALLWYDPRPHLPTQADREAGEAVLERIRAIEGDVFMPGQGYLARLAGKRGTAHASAIRDVSFDLSRDASKALRAQLRTALAEQRFAAVIGAVHLGHAELFRQQYPRSEPIGLPPRTFLPVEGIPVRPERVYFRGVSSISR